MATLLNTLDHGYAREICASFENKPDALLEILHGVQAKEGFVSETALRTIAEALNISRAEIHGVSTFYHDYKFKKGAKTTVKICRAEACQAVGVETLIDEAQAHFGVKFDDHEPSGDLALEAAYCLGNCALGPAVLVGDDLYGRVDLDRLKAIISGASS